MSSNRLKFIDENGYRWADSCSRCAHVYMDYEPGFDDEPAFFCCADGVGIPVSTSADMAEWRRKREVSEDSICNAFMRKQNVCL